MPQPLVEISQAIVIGIARERPLGEGDLPLVGLSPALGQEPQMSIRPRHQPSRYGTPGGNK